jgi:IclR family pca regulon transcriptional regulator
MVDQELELGLMSMAAPIQDGSGRVVAAVNISLRTQSVLGGKESLDAVREVLLATAARISADVAVTG